MKKIILIVLILAFVLSNFNFTMAASSNDDIKLLSFKVLSEGPYYKGQKVNATFSIINKGDVPLELDTVTVSGVINNSDKINFKWYRNISIEPGEVYTYIGYYIFEKSGEYILFPTIKKLGENWDNTLDEFDENVKARLTINVENSDKPRIIYNKLPDGVINNSYGPVNIVVTNKNLPLKYTVSSGNLPDGLKLTEDGKILGSPIKLGDYKFTIKAQNDFGYTEEEFEINIKNDRLSIIGYIDRLYEGRTYKISDLIYSKNDIDAKYYFSISDTEYAVVENNLLKTIKSGSTILVAKSSESKSDEKSILINISKNNEFEVVFKDILGHWGSDEIARLYLQGAINGYPNGKFLPDSNIKKSEIVTMLCKSLYVKKAGINREYKDTKNHWARNYIDIVGEYFMNSGEYFKPDEYATREEIITAIIMALGLDNEVIDPTILNDYFKDANSIDDKYKKFIAIALEKGIIKGFEDRKFRGKNLVTRAQSCKIIENAENIGGYSLLANDFNDFVIEEVDIITDVNNPNADRDLRNQRLEYIFGTDDNGNYKYYTTEEAAKVNMVKVEIPAWNLDKNNNKISKSYTFLIHKNIAAQVLDIFKTIYNDPEKFPIKDIGGYAWRAPRSNGVLSEHNYGTCIDINYNENPYIVNGKLQVGVKWEPGKNQYSITPEGSVLKAFRKYKWAWGGSDWSGTTKDYMHFSYLGH